MTPPFDRVGANPELPQDMSGEPGNLGYAELTFGLFHFFCVAYETERLSILSINSFIEYSHLGSTLYLIPF